MFSGLVMSMSLNVIKTFGQEWNSFCDKCMEDVTSQMSA